MPWQPSFIPWSQRLQNFPWVSGFSVLTPPPSPRPRCSGAKGGLRLCSPLPTAPPAHLWLLEHPCPPRWRWGWGRMSSNPACRHLSTFTSWPSAWNLCLFPTRCPPNLSVRHTELLNCSPFKAQLIASLLKLRHPPNPHHPTPAWSKSLISVPAGYAPAIGPWGTLLFASAVHDQVLITGWLLGPQKQLWEITASLRLVFTSVPGVSCTSISDQQIVWFVLSSAQMSVIHIVWYIGSGSLVSRYGLWPLK